MKGGIIFRESAIHNIIDIYRKVGKSINIWFVTRVEIKQVSDNKSTKMTYKDTAPPQAKQVVSHNRNPSDVLLATFRHQHNETEEKIPFSKKVPMNNSNRFELFYYKQF